jgi:hypothetical protein
MAGGTRLLPRLTSRVSGAEFFYDHARVLALQAIAIVAMPWCAVGLEAVIPHSPTKPMQA